MIHWTWIVFVVVVVLLLIAIYKQEGDYNFATPFLILILIAFILTWGGVFWW